MQTKAAVEKLPDHVSPKVLATLGISAADLSASNQTVKSGTDSVSSGIRLHSRPPISSVDNQNRAFDTSKPDSTEKEDASTKDSWLSAPVRAFRAFSDRMRVNDDDKLKPQLKMDDLREGDILIVRGFNPVSVSQAVTQFLGSSVGRRGSPSSIHVMLVTSAYSGYALAAHMVRNGPSIDYIRDADPLDPKSDAPIPQTVSCATVHRLSDERVRKTAAAIARDVVKSDRVKFDIPGSISSVLKDMRIDEMTVFELLNAITPMDKLLALHEDEVHLGFYCTDFVAKCYQLALKRLGLLMSHRYRRYMNVDGEACSPQSFEGYLLHQADKYGDWKEIGCVTYEFM